MKNFMSEMMGAMMPYMVPLVWLGGALLALGVIMVFVRLVSGSGRGLVRLAGTGLLVLGIFFLACQGAGLFLGANPAINFGDSTKFEFNLKPFWMVGLAMLIPGFLLRLVSGRRD